MEVAFTSDNSRRRRWSFAGGNLDRTACFVHSLLDNEKQDGLGDIQEDTGPEFDRAADKISVLDFDERRPSQDSGAAVLHSRLLTKKQLTDLALNVRGLSRRLSKIKLRLDVKTVFVLTKVYDESLIENTRQITRWLLSKDRRTPYVVYVEKTLQKNGRFDAAGLVAEEPSAAGRLQFWDVPLVQERTFDFVVTLGGDGTVLYASRLFQQIVPPVLSFALGSLGFLTKFDFDRYQQILTEAFRDGVAVSLRLRFECTVMRSQTRQETADEKASKRRDLVEELIGVASKDDMTHAPDQVFQILNEVVVDRGPNPTMSSLEIFGDDQHFTTVQADGICISTPTGSTAYNLAAGGALSHPENPVVLITAICAHTLSFRPIILPDTIVLRVGVPYDARTGSWASFDGRERIELQPGDYVTVSASRYPFAYVMPPDRRSVDWIESISRTLNWNSRKKQKAFEQKESE